MRLGFYKVVGFIRKVFKRPGGEKDRENFVAIKDGVKRMKRETEKSIISHFKDYRENIKFQYVFKLVDAEADALYESLLDHFQAYVTDLSNIVENFEDHKEDRVDASAILVEMEAKLQNIQERIGETRTRISQEL